MKKSLVALFALVASCSLLACASEDEPQAPAAEAGSEDDLTASATKSCGAAYTPALRKYELAVQASKRLLAGDMCDEMTHDKDKSLATTITREDIASLMLTSIEECGAFRDVFNKSPYATPVRKALAESLLSRVASGALSSETFAGLGKALPGTTLYGPKPGVALSFWVDFGADGQATFHRYDFELEREVSEAGSYTVTEGAEPTVTITKDGTTTTYGVRYESNDRYRDIVFVPATEDDAPISTSSDPCSA